jgi:dihydroorotate dehydrogenase (NAD+) catalytic subunit
MAVAIGRLKMANPIMVASGCFGYGEEIARSYPLSRLGAVVVKGTTLEPRPGNPPPRMAETPAGMLNAIGLQNVGVEAFLKEKLPFLVKARVPCVVNINGRTVEEYAELARRLDGVAGVGALEVNISCPNVKEGGIEFGSSPEGASRVVAAVRKATRHTLITKLSPNAADVRVVARACVDAGTDALSAINTLVGMAIDARSRRPVLRNVTGGLSGPAIKPVGLRVIYQLAQALKVPLVGMGGVVTGEDAAEYLLAGATAVAVGTANYLQPCAALSVVEGLEDFLREQGVADVRELVGALRVPGK